MTGPGKHQQQIGLWTLALMRTIGCKQRQSDTGDQPCDDIAGTRFSNMAAADVLGYKNWQLCVRVSHRYEARWSRLIGARWSRGCEITVERWAPGWD